MERVFDYWKNVDAQIGKRIEEKAREQAGDVPPGVEQKGVPESQPFHRETHTTSAH